MTGRWSRRKLANLQDAVLKRGKRLPRAIVEERVAVLDARPFGLAAKADFLFEDGLTYLNHGAFGATSRPVMAAAQAWRDRSESQPSRFLTAELGPLLRETAVQLGGYVGADGSDIVFQDNATTAINAVLRSLVLFPGDEVLTTSMTYGAVMRTLEFVCDRADARLVPLRIDYPLAGPDAVLQAIEDGVTSRTRLVVIDHVTSKTAAILPVAEIAAECADRGIPVLVDGAHAPGMLDLDIRALGVDWYAGNCHKWLGAPRGSAFLWTRPERQPYMRPMTISHFVADGYIPAFDWPGTKDFTPYLSIPAAIDFRGTYGEDRIRDYCHALAVEAGRYLAQALGTRTGVPEGQTAFMTTVALPSGFGPANKKTADAIRAEIRNNHALEVDIQPFDGALWMRLSLYIYNDMDDIERLIQALTAVRG